MSKRKASDVFVECLEAEGVQHVFGIPGEETLDLNESLANSSVDSRVLAAGAVAGEDIQAAAVGPKKLKLDRLVKFLQTRATPSGARRAARERKIRRATSARNR